MCNSRKVLALAIAAILGIGANASYNIATNAEGVVSIWNTKAEFTDIRTPFLHPDVSSVVFSNNLYKTFHLYKPSTYTGGTVISATQIRPHDPGVFGSGKVLFKNGSIVVESALMITNQVCCTSDDAWLLGMDANALGLSALAPSSGYRFASIGRQGGNLATVRLALAGEQNEALSGIRMRGKLDLILDGAELKASAGGDNAMYFVDTTPQYDKRLIVSESGFSFDAGEGVDIDSGLPFADMTYGWLKPNIMASVAFYNGSFENGADGWTAKQVNSTGSIPGVKSNGDTTWVGTGSNVVKTPYGSKFYTIRSGQALVLDKAVRIEESGQWYVSYVDAPREGDHYHAIDTSVTVSNIATSVAQTLINPADGVHGFNEVTVGPFELEVGEYALIVENSRPASDTSNYGAVSYDNFELRKLSFSPVGFPFRKLGAGHLQLCGFADDYGSVSVQGGSLSLFDTTLKGTVVSADEGTMLTLGSVSLSDGAEVNIATAAKLRFSNVNTFGNLVADGSFEQNTVNGNKNFDNGIGSNWEVEVVEVNNNNNGANGAVISGIQGYGGNVTSGNRPVAVEGSGAYSAAIRCQVRINQTVTIPDDGCYILSFSAAKRYRSDYESTAIRLCPQIDGANIASIELGSEKFELTKLSVNLSKGEHKLSFYVDSDWTGDGGPMAFVDLVNLAPVVPIPDIENCSINLKSGSVLMLDNIQPVYVSDFMVDGCKIHGRRKHIEAAGVVVQGEGVIRVGNQTGSIVILR